MAGNLKALLQRVTMLWQEQIKLCEQRKQRDFGDTAKEIWKYIGQRMNPRYLMGAVCFVIGAMVGATLAFFLFAILSAHVDDRCGMAQECARRVI